MPIIKLPPKLKARLNEEHEVVILDSLIPFTHLLTENKLFFFPEYTDHGINHIEGVLRSIENLISDKTFEKLSSLDICAIIIATVLHDIGMHTSPELFRGMIEGKYDTIPDNFFNEKTWKELWYEYLRDSRFWNHKKKENVFGDKEYVIKEPNLSDLTENDIKFIGEFIRIHHARIAYEIALNGYHGDKSSIVFNFEKNQQLHNKKFLQISGLIARSHGMNVRDTFAYLKPYGKNLWKKPLDIKVVFLMTLIRIADYIQIDASRTDESTLKLRKFHSPYSLKEHETHLAIEHIHLENDDNELMYVEASPEDAKMYVKIENLIRDIQKELDLSWAILGEVYGEQYKLKYRRIESNLTDEDVKKGYVYVPKRFRLKFNNELPKLLIVPLYGDNPTYGVRELVQNAVDACRTRMALDEEYNNRTDFTHVKVKLDPKTAIFRIEDSGIGMNIEEIEKYFLTIGSSYGHSTDWKKTQDDTSMEINKIYRTGRFGIGILAAFLLGTSITVKTKRFKSEQGYEFTLSLDQDFIQINRISLPDYGTTIEIRCTDEALKQLNKDVDERLDNEKYNFYDDWYWFDWYVESKPKVEYSFGDQPIKAKMNLFTTYKQLIYKSNDYKDIYWQPYSLIYKHGYSKDLYCNGFFITDESNKTMFSFHNLEKYLPQFFRIPDLKLTDIYNQLPLNLQRNNIDENAEYGFEMDLLIAMCKDYLCQLLSMNINSKNFRKDIGCFFLHKDGYTFNHVYDFLSQRQRSSDLYPQKCFFGKMLVHFLCSNYSDFINWKPFITSHPEAFFTFQEYVRGVDDFLIAFLREKTDISRGFCAFNIDKLNKLRIKKNRIDFIKNSIRRDSSTTYDNYMIVANHHQPDYGFANDLVTYISSLSDKAKPFFFLIHSIEGENTPSPIDDFIKDYAGGDMIIPYFEEERKRKFAKIYQECGEDIKRYRE